MSRTARGRRLFLKRGRPDPRETRLDLQGLTRWAEGLGAADLYTDDHYQDFKLGISDATAFEAMRRPIVERRIMEALLTGAENLAGNPGRKGLPYSRVAVLAMPMPGHFWSRVTLFYDADYYRSKWFGDKGLPITEGPAARHGLSLPKGFDASGIHFSMPDEDAPDGIWEEIRWTYGEPV